MGFGPGPAASSGLVSAPVIALTHGVLRSMALVRLRAAVGLVMAVGIAVSFWAGAASRHQHRRRGRTGRTPAEGRSPFPDQPLGTRASPTSTRSAPAVPDWIRPNPILAAGETPPPAVAAGPVAGSLPRRSSSNLPLRRKWLVPPPPRDPEPAQGEMLFAKEWVGGDPASHGGDGLGPLYNDTSCVACHGLGAPGGAGPESKNVVLVAASSNGCGSSGEPRSALARPPGAPAARSSIATPPIPNTPPGGAVSSRATAMVRPNAPGERQ